MAFDASTLDAPFAALGRYDWGGDAGSFKTIDAAVVAAHGDAALRADLEKRLTAILVAGVPRGAQEYACRKLAVIGTAASVPALAALLPDANLSHMGRFALERIPAEEAAAALRAALQGVGSPLKVGIISSLAGRRDAASVPALAALLAGDPTIAAAAAAALGRIAISEAAAALAGAAPQAPAVDAVIDGRLACAAALLAAGDRAAAKTIYLALEPAGGGATHRQRAIRTAVQAGLFAAGDDTIAP